jgi:hypothetical protein
MTSLSRSAGLRWAALIALALFSLAMASGCDPQRWRYVHALKTGSGPPPFTSYALAITGDMANGSAAVGQTNIVEMFSGNWGWWLPQGVLNPQKGIDGTFGAAVALDGNTLAVGAPFNDPFTNGAYQGDDGYVAIFGLDATGTWGPTQTVTHLQPTPPPNGTWPPTDSTLGEFSFGGSVALEGDTLVVGASRFWDGVGRAFVFKSTNGHFDQVLELKEPDSDQRSDANFGDSVRISGGTIAISRPDTPASTGPGPKFGKVYVYPPAGSGWGNPQVIERFPNPTDDAYDAFGSAIALSGDWLAVRKSAGVEVFKRTAGVWAFAWEVAAATGAGRGSIDLGEFPRVLVVGNADPTAGQVHIYWPPGDPFITPSDFVRTAGYPGAGPGFGAVVAVKNSALLSATLRVPFYVLSYVDGPY